MVAEALLASVLYANSQGSGCSGQWRCHWCGGSCTDIYKHDDDPEIPGVKRNRNLAKCPGNPYICQGCWLWRRKRITVRYSNPDRPILDRQSPCWHSWFITYNQALAIHPSDYGTLLDTLLAPPTRFALCLLTSPLTPENRVIPAICNHIHLAAGNHFEKIETGTQLAFTVNNVIHHYTVYELDEATRHGPDGKEPGVRVLFDLLGVKAICEKRGRGRPPALKEAEEVFTKIVTEHPAHTEIRPPVSSTKPQTGKRGR